LILLGSDSKLKAFVKEYTILNYNEL
jgi:hypothetical protein